jgi:hypothetical protein
MQWTAHIACTLKIKNYMGKLQRQNPLEGYRSTCGENIKMAFLKIGWKKWAGFNWLRIEYSG